MLRVHGGSANAETIAGLQGSGEHALDLDGRLMGLKPLRAAQSSERTPQLPQCYLTTLNTLTIAASLELLYSFH